MHALQCVVLGHRQLSHRTRRLHTHADVEKSWAEILRCCGLGKLYQEPKGFNEHRVLQRSLHRIPPNLSDLIYQDLSRRTAGYQIPDYVREISMGRKLSEALMSHRTNGLQHAPEPNLARKREIIARQGKTLHQVRGEEGYGSLSPLVSQGKA